MSTTELETETPQPNTRKRNAEAAEIEIDVEAPEPPSKKALRKAKKAKVSNESTSSSEAKKTKPPTETQDVPQKDSTRSQHGIWIGNLSFGTTKDDLIRFLTSDLTNVISRNQITRIHLPQGPPKFGKAQNKGFAYIDFSDQQCIDMALTLSESLLGGRPVLIKNAKNFEGRPEQKRDHAEKQSRPPSKRIFVGNLDFTTTVEDLEAHFGVCGPVVHTHMATFEDSGKCKGFAWIDFEQLESAEKAMRGWVERRDSAGNSPVESKSSKSKILLHRLHGRKLRMEYAEDKATRYEKRFGKSAKKTATGEGDSREDSGIMEVDNGEEKTESMYDNKKMNPSKAQGKYSEETVQRLTGAIIESKGQRTVFE
ncbi:uncharacterized protein Z520_00997 [Fonsecaea multimorphosa CBS 102226]|uniref:RRM domain-containing protein n=1 Tax=Fonsecaea multimorphosa CBS 102226 TaxID=1442371 RepID=A0A0D2IZN1_9EURO|nr:uncharacterized protein Z520_00997 [Fonsecaea multimorphosa CBS 102226]KIY02532.1 hypothetical protein Z520_00997 [Fonsecaea multimorphosa CBS 102226]OAL31399.1 hypothetical protein AYO22_00991 [Fonsecaea multimorphosa]